MQIIIITLFKIYLCRSSLQPIIVTVASRQLARLEHNVRCLNCQLLGSDTRFDATDSRGNALRPPSCARHNTLDVPMSLGAESDHLWANLLKTGMAADESRVLYWHIRTFSTMGTRA